MIWEIRYWVDQKGKGAVENWLNTLTKQELKAVAREVKLLEYCGNNLRLPHSKPLGKGLFELRERRYGYRIYYCFLNGRVILLLGAGNKSSQSSDIQVARDRLKIIKDQGDETDEN